MDKAKLIIHPIRLRMVDALAGRQLTSRQFAAIMPDIPQASLYRHLSSLVAGKVFEVVSERKVRGIVERTYALPPSAAHLTREDFEKMSSEDHRHYFSVFLGELSSRMNRYLDQPGYSPTEDGMTYFTFSTNLTPEEARQFRLDLLEFVQARSKPVEGRRRYKLGAAFMPEAETALQIEPK
jgi:hypothetical protein